MLKPSARRSFVALVMAAMALGGAHRAAAETEPLPPGLAWRAPSGCPSAAVVMAEISHNMSGAGMAPFAAVVEVRGPADGLWQATLQFQANDARAKRRFEAESCEAIASAAALVIALWAEDGADAPEPAAPPPTTDEHPLPAVSPAPFEPPPALEVHRNPVITTSSALAPAAPAFEPGRSQFVVMVNGLVDRGTIPTDYAGGLEVSGGRIWAGPSWRVRALGSLSYFPMQLYHPWNNVRESNFQLVDASSRGCFSLGDDLFQVGPCLGLELAGMRGTGEAFDHSNQIWFSVLGSAVATLKVWSGFAVFARVEAVVPTIRARYHIAGDGPYDYYQVPAIAGRGAAGIELPF